MSRATRGIVAAGPVRVGPVRVLVVDNYDSFVYNLVQYLAQLGADTRVRRTDLRPLAARRPGAGAEGG